MSDLKAGAPDMLDPERWQRLKDVLADALEEKTHAARSAVVERRCAGDEYLLAEAESLLREAEALLESPTDELEDCAEQATRALWQDEAPRTGWRIGAYVVVRELGRGGMGAVYLAARADGQFEKQVAIKVLKRGTDTDEVLRRFAAERHILARLDHPNIARLLDAGTTDDGLPYFVMEYVDGVPVTRFAREHELSIEQRLAIFLKVCSAVEVAHHNHVIHRDLKPSNILVNAQGEPKLLDFGIAKLLGTGQDCLEITAAGEERLTPNCASPEQVDGRPVTEASDVYALGALLYELLTREKPHKFSSPKPSRQEVVHVIRDADPQLPSVVARERGLRGDLDAIVMRALRKEPAARYPNVAEVAEDVRRYLAHAPVLARRGSTAYRARSLVRKPGFRRVAVAAVILLAAIGGWALWRHGRQSAANFPVAIYQSAVAPDGRMSIAVLPFENFADENPSYFADGVQDNILTDLAKVRGLKVLSRSAVAPYRGQKKNARDIGRELGVANILLGSVQRAGDRVRINAQLIDTNTDTQIWAEHYDRKIEDIFAVQSELAQTIVAQLQTTLSSGEQAAIWKQPTQDLQAYELYMRVRASLNGSIDRDESVNWQQGVDLLQQAIARDPKFTGAYCLLNELHLLLYRFGNDRAPQRLTAAREAAETALRLEPNLEEARLALARYYYNGLNEYRRTEEELAKIPPSDAHSVEFHTLASLVERRLGKWAESLRDGDKAMELDPQNGELAVNQVQTYMGLRRFPEAIQVADAALARLHNPPPRLFMVRGDAAIGMGNFGEARAAFDASPRQDGMDFQFARIWSALLSRDFASAKAVAANAGEGVKEMPSYWLILGAVHRAEGNREEQRAAFTEAKRRARIALQTRPQDAEVISELASAESGLGNHQEAIRQARRAAELTPPSLDALVGPRCEMRLGEVLAAAGDRDGAFAKLNDVVKLPFGISYGDLKLNPMWDGLRDDPRFEQLMAEAMKPL